MSLWLVLIDLKLDLCLSLAYGMSARHPYIAVSAMVSSKLHPVAKRVTTAIANPEAFC